jgi:hypothetical protein
MTKLKVQILLIYLHGMKIIILYGFIPLKQSERNILSATAGNLLQFMAKTAKFWPEKWDLYPDFSHSHITLSVKRFLVVAF